MKRITALIMIFVMCLSLGACSDQCDCGCAYCCGAETQGTDPEQTQPVENTKQSADKIEFTDPVLLAEDDRIRVEMTNFFQEVEPYSGHEPEKDKFITLKLYNKTDFEMRVQLNQLSIGNEAATCTYHQAQIPKILPGQTMVCFVRINLGLNDLVESMEQLYGLEGIFEVERTEARIENGHHQYDTRKIPFSVYGAFSGNIIAAVPVEEEAAAQTQAVLQPEKLTFDPPVLLAEDQKLRLELVDFYQDIWEMTGEVPVARSHITIRFHNKTNEEMMISPEDFYLENRKVICVQSDGTPSMLGGKFADYSFQILYDTNEQLASLKELYLLNGRFEVFRVVEDTLYDGYYFPFSVSDVFS